MVVFPLALPTPDVEALIQGRMIVAMPRLFLQPGREFALYPVNLPPHSLPLEKSYRPSFMAIAQSALAKLHSEKVLIKAWARCELCQTISNAEVLESLSRLTIWTTEGLEQNLLERPHLFIAYLRVYALNEPIEVEPVPNTENNIGKFVCLPNLKVGESQPVLSDTVFAQRCYRLKNQLPPQHPELEELQAIVAQYAIEHPEAKGLDQDIQGILGWGKTSRIQTSASETDWIGNISDVGNSSDGNEFEKLVRKSFILLGFKNSNQNPKTSLNPESTGGAGGLDFYCEEPYLVVGECKATKNEKVNDGTPAQLVKLGYKHLQRKYNECIKIIMAAGELNEDANLTALGNEMNVIRPETLQKLVQLKRDYPGCIDLYELKPILQNEPHGEDADTKVNSYIDQVCQRIKQRSYIVQLVKNSSEPVSIEYLRGAYDTSNPPHMLPISNQKIHEILIELSSPLAGYLGREKGEDWKSDRFYFLRDLETPEIEN